MKLCSRCNIEKPFEAFNKNSRAKDGCQTACRECFAAYNAARYIAKADEIKARTAEWAKANPQRKRQRNAEWQKANPAKHRAMSAKWYADNQEKAKAHHESYREQNREKVRASKSMYKRSNPHKVREHAGRRRSATLCATPKWADHQKIAAVYAEAVRLSIETGIPHHVDHVVPLIGKLTKTGPQIVCGLHWEANLAPIPASDNCKKGFYSWPDMP